MEIGKKIVPLLLDFDTLKKVETSYQVCGSLRFSQANLNQKIQEINEQFNKSTEKINFLIPIHRPSVISFEPKKLELDTLYITNSCLTRSNVASNRIDHITIRRDTWNMDKLVHFTYYWMEPDQFYIMTEKECSTYYTVDAHIANGKLEIKYKLVEIEFGEFSAEYFNKTKKIKTKKPCIPREDDTTTPKLKNALIFFLTEAIILELHTYAKKISEQRLPKEEEEEMQIERPQIPQPKKIIPIVKRPVQPTEEPEKKLKTEAQEGGSKYYHKYLKYKTKYLNLKN